jgi:hypothetical protein
VCQAYSEAVDEADLNTDRAAFDAQPAEAKTQARELLRNQSSMNDLVRAEGRLLRRLGVQPNIAEMLEGELREALRKSMERPPLVNTVFRVKELICALRDQLRDEARRERRKKRIWGGVMGLAGVVIAGASAPLLVLAPPVGLAIGASGAALAAEGLHRAMGK